jgi:hypothetical protein
LLWNGGPGPHWTLDNSWIEPGIRELTSVVIMPSFVRGMRVDVSGDWYRLHDPDERKLHTARTVEIGRQINEARECLEEACKCGKYRPEDTERLRVRLHQLETMLPMQTQFVKVPYENTLGGFALFTQGATSLVPELSGFEGLEYIDPDKGGDIIVYGKHFSVQPSADNNVVPTGYLTSNPLAVIFEFVIQAAAPANAGAAQPATAQAAGGGAPANGMAAASALLPGGYSRGIVPARDVATGAAESEKGDFRFASHGIDPSARRVTADSQELLQPFRLPDTDREGGSVIRTQTGGPASGTNQPITIPNPTTLVLPSAAPAQTAQSLVVVPRSPSVNVSVPVTNNNSSPARRLGSLFHRRNTPATPQNPTRPPLLERLRGGN